MDEFSPIFVQCIFERINCLTLVFICTVVECPSEDYLEPFVNHPVFAKHQMGGVSKTEDIPYCVVHFTPQSVMNNPRYADWMSKFGFNTRHIVVNEENTCMGTESVYRHQHKLHILHPDIFPFLNEDGFKKKIRVRHMKIVRHLLLRHIVFNYTLITHISLFQLEDPPSVHRPRTHHSVQLQPKLNFNTEKEIVLQPKVYLNEVFEIDGFLDALAELQTIISNREKQLLVKNEYPKLVMLGTGCSVPNKVRNTSGILLRIDENYSMLLDCGEGTMGQIVRIYGRSEADNVIKTIKV